MKHTSEVPPSQRQTFPEPDDAGNKGGGGCCGGKS